jgi:translation elongation factor EF-Tu-like GTPase
VKRPPFDLPAPGAPGAAEQARAGETVLVTITLAQPAAMAASTRFAIQAGGHTVAAGTVTA